MILFTAEACKLNVLSCDIKMLNKPSSKSPSCSITEENVRYRAVFCFQKIFRNAIFICFKYPAKEFHCNQSSHFAKFINTLTMFPFMGRHQNILAKC